MKFKITRLLWTMLLTFSLFLGVKAQDQVFKKSDKDFSVGVGFGSSYIYSGYSIAVPPIVATFDLGLRDDWGPGVFGVGAYISSSLYTYRSTNPYTGQSYGYNYTTFILGGRATYHYTFVDKLDTYGGVILGFRINASSETGDHSIISSDPDNSFDLVHTPFAGVKYYFTPGFSVYNELSLGWGIPYFSLGVTFKF
jgi:hypothetical protein